MLIKYTLVFAFNNIKKEKRNKQTKQIIKIKGFHKTCLIATGHLTAYLRPSRLLNRDLTKLQRQRQGERQKSILKTTTLHVHHAYLYVSLQSDPWPTTTRNDQILSLLENGNCKAINLSTISVWTRPRPLSSAPKFPSFK